MVIEWLKFQVTGVSRETYVQKDEEIWTTALAKYPGFMGKEVWISPHNPEEIVFVIQWKSRKAWHSIPESELAEIEKRFDDVIGKHNYKLVEEGEYQIRKFAR